MTMILLSKAKTLLRTGLALAALAGLSACIATTGGGASTSASTSSGFSKSGDQRVIPVALWAGSDWAKTKDQTLPKVDTLTGKNKDRRIRGPIDWTHPKTGEKMKVYERVSAAKDGEKRQLYALTHDGAALGRVFDSRPGQPDRYFVGDAIFPLGPWRAGEQRRFFTIEYSGDEMRILEERLRLRKLSFAYDGAPESLKFDWRQRSEDYEVLFDERYIYSPGRSLARFENRLSQ
jgi:hypothetical protein